MGTDGAAVGVLAVIFAWPFERALNFDDFFFFVDFEVVTVFFLVRTETLSLDPLLAFVNLVVLPRPAFFFDFFLPTDFFLTTVFLVGFFLVTFFFATVDS